MTRKCFSRGRLTAAVISLLVLGSPAVAAAAPAAWTTPETITTGDDLDGGVGFAVGTDGAISALATRCRHDTTFFCEPDSAHSIHLYERPAGAGAFSTRQVTSDWARNPTVLADRLGGFHAAWETSTRIYNDSRFTTLDRDPGQDWGPPADGPTEAPLPRGFVSTAQGATTLLQSTCDAIDAENLCQSFTLRTKDRAPGGSYAASPSLSTEPLGTNQAALAADSSGRQVLLYSHYWDNGSTTDPVSGSELRLRERAAPATPWSDDDVISGPRTASSATAPQVSGVQGAVGEDGSAIVIWDERSELGTPLYAMYRSPEGVWTARQPTGLVDTRSNLLTYVDEHPAMLFANESETGIDQATYVDGSWTRSAVTTGLDRPRLRDVATDAQGNTLLLYETVEAGSDSVDETVLHPAGGPWQAPLRVPRPANGAAYVNQLSAGTAKALAMDGRGNAYVGFQGCASVTFLGSTDCAVSFTQLAYDVPTVQLTGGPPALTNADALTFTFSVDPADAQAECRLDAGAWTDCSSGSYAISAVVPDGPHTFAVRARRGESVSEPTERAFTRDRVAPTFGLIDAPASTTERTLAFDFELSEPAAIDCALDGAEPEGCTDPQVFGDLALGAHTLTAHATDPAGNRSTPLSHAFTVHTATDPGTGTGTGTGPSVPPLEGPGNGDSCQLEPDANSPFDDAALGGTTSGRRSTRAAGASKCPGWPSKLRDADCVTGSKAELAVTNDITVQALDRKACFVLLKENGNWVTAGPVRVNGLIFRLAPGGKITVNERDNKIITGGATLYLTPGAYGIPIGNWDWSFATDGNKLELPVKGTLPAGRTAGPGAKLARFLGGLPITRDFTIGFSGDAGGTTKLKADVALPDAFKAGAPFATKVLSANGGNGVAVELDLQTSNANGPGGTIGGKVSYMRLGPLSLTNASLAYQFSTRSILFSTRATFASPARVKPPLEFKTSGQLAAGGLVQASLAAVNLNKPVAYGFFLQELGGAYDLTNNQGLFSGNGRITWGPEIRNLADPRQDEAFSILSVAGKLTVGTDSDGHAILSVETVKASKENGELGTTLLSKYALPTGKILYDWNDAKFTVDSAWDETFVPGVLAVKLNIKGEFASTDRKFLGGSATLFGFNGSRVTGQGYVDTEGAGVCVSGEPDKPLAAKLARVAQGKPAPRPASWGAVRYRQGQTVYIGGNCDTSQWVANGLPPYAAKGRAAAFRAAPAGARTFPVAKGQDLIALRVVGTSAAPRAVLTGPGGASIQADPAQVRLEAGGITVFGVPDQRTTYIVVRDPKPGTWTLSGEGIERVDGAAALPDPSIGAKATVRAGQVRIAYRVAALQPGERVELWEQFSTDGVRLLGRARGTGTLRARLSGVKGAKLVQARVLRADGTLRTTVDLTSYVDPGPKPLAAPKVKLVRKGTKVLVSWKGPTGVTWYVDARLGDRASTTQTTKTKLTLRGVAAGTKGKLLIYGVAKDGTVTKIAKVTLKAVKRR